MLPRRLFLAVGAAATAAIISSSAAFAGSVTLHPAGFGPHSYAAWKAQQGLPDDRGNANQALYFQKMTATATYAAGVAVIKGFEGMPLSELTGLSWDHRDDGHCGAGAPRWNVGVKDTLGNTYNLFFGCYAATHTPVAATDPGGHQWCHDEQPAPSSTTNAADLTITGLAIVFDEGTDTLNPPPAPCAQESVTGGFVYLDNITVQTTVGSTTTTYVWTSAADNGNGDPSTQPAPASPYDMPTASTLSPDLLSSLTGELTGLLPGLAPASLNFYEDVLI